MKHSNRPVGAPISSRTLSHSFPSQNSHSYRPTSSITSSSQSTSLKTSPLTHSARSLRTSIPSSALNSRLSTPTSQHKRRFKPTTNTRMSTLSTTVPPPQPPTFSENDNLMILCDVQENFRPVMPRFNNLINASKLLLNASNVLKIPLIVSEQNPFKPTIDELSSIISHRLNTSPDGQKDESGNDSDAKDEHVYTFRKSRFSLINEDVHNIINQVKPRRIVLFGLEAHVCILQTAHDLVNCLDSDLYKRPFDIYLVTDATISQRDGDRDIAFRQLESAGVRLTTAESIVYEIMEDAKHPGFKKMLPFVKEHGAYYANQNSDKH